MQYRIYRNLSNSESYPYLLDVQSDIIDVLTTRLVIPLFPLKLTHTRPPERLCPAIETENEQYLVMTHEMASVTQTLLGNEVMDAQPRRQQIKEAIDFLVDGFF